MKIQDNPQSYSSSVAYSIIVRCFRRLVKKKNRELVDLWFLKFPQKENHKKGTAGIGPMPAFRPAGGWISACAWTFSLCEFWEKFL